MATTIFAFSLIGKFGVSASFASIYMYSAEIYPTETRSLCIGICDVFARFGTMLAPVIAHLVTLSWNNVNLSNFRYIFCREHIRNLCLSLYLESYHSSLVFYFSFFLKLTERNFLKLLKKVKILGKWITFFQLNQS